MIVKYNNKIVTKSHKWCSTSGATPVPPGPEPEQPTILYPKNTSVVNSLALSNLPTITQRYGVVSFDNKPYIGDNAETETRMGLSRMDIHIFMAYNWGGNYVGSGWQRHISFASTYDGDRYTTRFATFTPVDNIGTTTSLHGIGAQVIFNCYENYNLYRNNEYTHVKLVFDRNTNIVYVYLNNVYMGYGTIYYPSSSDQFLWWYSGGGDNPSTIYGNSLKNIEIVSFDDFEAAAAYYG